MANTQTSVPVFTAGQVLTAAQQNAINTGVPVFATSVTRDAAFGGTGEKTLAEGQFAFLEDSNTTQFYDGANWQSVGVNPGLVCVKAETAFSAVASVVCDDVFSSSYTAYKLIIRSTMTTNTSFNLKLRVGGVAASTNYNVQNLIVGNTAIVATRDTAATSFGIGSGSTGTFFQSNECLITGPALAEGTTFMNHFQNSDAAYNVPLIKLNYGNHSTATAYDGFEINAATGTMTGVYSVYGFSKVV
jgi:hypothetical protein